MNALDVRRGFAQSMLEHGFAPLQERALTDASDNYFVGSAIMAYPTVLDHWLSARQSSKHFAQQRVFWTRYLSLAGHNPMWSIFQVMMSFYWFSCNGIHEPLEMMRRELTQTYGIEDSDIFLLVEDDMAMRSAMMQGGLEFSNVILWKAMPKMMIRGTAVGTYAKIFVRHHEGVLPLWDMIYRETEPGRFNIDSSLVLERLAFVVEDADTWFETELFHSLLESFAERHPSLDKTHARTIAVLMRGLVATVCDEALPAAKGLGYVVRKTLREMLGIAWYDAQTPEFSIGPHINSALQCLKQIGYVYDLPQANLTLLAHEEELFRQSVERAKRVISRDLDRRLRRGTVQVQSQDLDHWAQTYGAPWQLIEQLLNCYGGKLDKNEEQKRPMFSDGYGWEERKVADPMQWLVDMEVVMRNR